MFCTRKLSGAKLKKIREQHELSQAQIALFVGLTQQSISKYEKTGISNLWVIQKIAALLRCEVSDLYKD